MRRSSWAVLGGFVVAIVVLVLVRKPEVGLWDWDTYGRLEFIHVYNPTRYVDGHLLYHGVMRVLMGAGFTDVGAVVVETALGMAAFLALLATIAIRAKLRGREVALVLAAATIGSPGLVALVLMSEDNVLYWPIVLAAFALAARPTGDRRAELRRGLALGALLAAAMLVNISLLVLVFVLPPAIAILVWRPADRPRALGLAVALVATLALYYAAHVVPFGGARIALHEFLPEALGLHDFHLSSTPTVSLARFAEYRGGLRAMALTPNLHLMAPPDGLRALLVSVLPLALVAGVATVLAWVVARRRVAAYAVGRARIELVGLFAIALVFPYFYEPSLIERWDVFWVGALFALVPLLAARPPRVIVGVLAALIAIGGVGTTVVVVHHYGAAWTDPTFAQWRAAIRVIRARHAEVVVVPYAMPRLLLADLAYRIGAGPRLYLVRDDGACFQFVYMTEQPVERAFVTQLVREQRATAWLDPAVAPWFR